MMKTCMKLTIQVWGSMDEDLAIVPHAGHDDDSAVDADVDPISFSLPQPVLTSAGMP